MQEATELDIALYRKIFADYIPYHRLLGFELDVLQQGKASLIIPYKKELLGNIVAGNFHGGVIVSAMDSIGGMAAMTMIDIKVDKIATIDIRTDFLSPAKKDNNVVVEAQVQKSGNRVVFTHIQAYHQGKPEHILAEGRAIYSVKRKS
ncbi:PaaI family thioesterase [Microscilla marina]|uniref:Thioesterase family protein n=1 Tax=Microscilla marina ATCC 23134 TaxID=313606 RepID=A1ZDI7_MICM2|nr:PaaI family thioesterase [Microscilla marina]EAY31726.1 thioesterase family protein [Microscilla marina ATCC 23134]